MRKLLLLAPLFVAPFLVGAAPATQPATQPVHDRDPWIFRCVLDGNARMVVVSLGNHYWAAYDAAHCALAKVWEGDVELTGAVYDMRHGPQPKAKGKVLLDRTAAVTHVHELTKATAEVVVGDAKLPAPDNFAYRGYSENGGLATFHFECAGIRIDETPSVAVDSNGRAIFRRTITVTRPADRASKSDSVYVAVPTSELVGEVRLVKGNLTESLLSSRIFFAPAEISFSAGKNLNLLALGSEVIIDTEFKPADQQPPNAAK